MDNDIQPILDVIDGYKPDSSWLFAEIGSRTGDVTQYMYDTYGCRCVGIEPDGEWYRTFRHAVIGKPISAFWGAVGSQEGSVWYQRTENEDGEIGGNIVDWVSYKSVVARYEVPSYTWNSFVRDCCWDFAPDILLMDCEGAETTIVPQIQDSKVKPKRILIEWHTACYGNTTRDQLIEKLEPYYEHRKVYYQQDAIYGEFIRK